MCIDKVEELIQSSENICLLGLWTKIFSRLQVFKTKTTEIKTTKMTLRLVLRPKPLLRTKLVTAGLSILRTAAHQSLSVALRTTFRLIKVKI